jgi:hypothetical protein
MTRKHEGEQHAAQITTTKSFKFADGSESIQDPKDELISVHRFETEPAIVRVGFGLTINLGNYESARVDVSVAVPCYKEQVESALDELKSLVEKRIQDEVDDIQSSKKTKSPF